MRVCAELAAVGVRPRGVRFGVAGLVLVAVVAGAVWATGARGGGGVAQAAARASPAVCERPRLGRLAYGYPVRPFGRQHPIRGNFGDPRTLVGESGFGADTPRSPGSFTFHNGVDISAPTATAVYPVVSGVARIGYADEVIVVTADGRRFQYFHIRPAVRPGQRVTAYRTLLGRILPGWGHVHLTEIDGFRVHNPVDPGHLEPYRDQTSPAVDALLFSSENGQALDPQKLRGRVLIAANARDTPPLPVPGPWFDFPVTPALVAWRLATAKGRIVLPERVTVDFRHREPPNRDFWRVYAAGTYQNFPVFGHRYFFRRPGRYLFNLTPTPLDTRRLPDGDYILTVAAADVCGNRGSLSERVRIRNH
jgi:murein DD-endopeptidase MepM/ murein hydrolase activator NlpD